MRAWAAIASASGPCVRRLVGRRGSGWPARRPARRRRAPRSGGRRPGAARGGRGARACRRRPRESATGRTCTGRARVIADRVSTSSSSRRTRSRSRGSSLGRDAGDGREALGAEDLAEDRRVLEQRPVAPDRVRRGATRSASAAISGTAIVRQVADRPRTSRPAARCAHRPAAREPSRPRTAGTPSARATIAATRGVRQPGHQPVQQPAHLVVGQRARAPGAVRWRRPAPQSGRRSKSSGRARVTTSDGQLRATSRADGR